MENYKYCHTRNDWSNTKLSVAYPAELRLFINRMALRDGVSQATVIRQAVYEYAKKNGFQG